MSDTITTLLVQIKGDATGVIAEFKNLASGMTGVNVQTQALNTSLANTGSAAHGATGHVAGLTYAIRSMFDQVRYGLGVGGPMAAFYAIDEATRALVANKDKLAAFGLTMADIALPAAALVSAIAGGFFVWEELGNHLEADTKRARELSDALEKIPGHVDKAYEAYRMGAITLAQLKQFEGYLSGATPLYLKPGDSEPSQEKLDDKNPPALDLTEQSRFYPSSTSRPGGRFYGSKSHVDLQQASQAAVNAYTDQLIEKAMAANAGTVAKNEVASADAQQQNKLDKPVEEASKKQDELLRQGLEIYKEQQQIIFGTAAKINEMSAKAAQEDARHEEELRKQSQMQAQATRDIQRSAIEAQIESVKADELMTDREKLQIVSALNAKLIQINQAEIVSLEALKTQVASLSDQLELEKKIADLKQQNQKLADQPTTEQQHSFSYQYGTAIVGQLNKWTGWAQESAKSFQNAWDGATNGVAGGLTHLFEYGAQKGQWFREMWNGVVGSLISSFTQMAVSWVMNHVLMEGVAIAFYAIMRALGLQDVAAKILGDNMKLISHIFGETTATTVTATQTGTRIAAHAAAAGAGAAESQASIPYIGPILAIAAIAAVVAAVVALAGGFAEGGYTGDGHPSQVAGVVHAGEYVIPANRVSSSLGLLQAIHSGAISDAAAPRAPGSLSPSGSSSSSAPASKIEHNTSIHMYQSRSDMARAVESDDAHEKWVVDVMARNAYKLQ